MHKSEGVGDNCSVHRPVQAFDCGIQPLFEKRTRKSLPRTISGEFAGLAHLETTAQEDFDGELLHRSFGKPNKFQPLGCPSINARAACGSAAVGPCEPRLSRLM